MDSSKHFACEICEKTFSSNKYKNQHIRIVHGEAKDFQFNTSKQFTKDKEITNVILVENPSHNQEI